MFKLLKQEIKQRQQQHCNIDLDSSTEESDECNVMRNKEVKDSTKQI